MRIFRMAALCACALLVASDLARSTDHHQRLRHQNADSVAGHGPAAAEDRTARLRGRVFSSDTGVPCAARKCASPARTSAPRAR